MWTARKELWFRWTVLRGCSELLTQTQDTVDFTACKNRTTYRQIISIKQCEKLQHYQDIKKKQRLSLLLK